MTKASAPYSCTHCRLCSLRATGEEATPAQILSLTEMMEAAGVLFASPTPKTVEEYIFTVLDFYGTIKK